MRPARRLDLAAPSLYRHRMYLAMIGTLEVTIGLVVLVVLSLTLRRFGARGWLVLGALLLTCFVTNPDKAKHVAAVKDKIVSHEPTAVGRIALDMAGGMVEPLLQYSNLGLLSITAADGNLVSVGLLNQVFVPGTAAGPHGGAS